MVDYHVYDPRFLNCSAELKRVLSGSFSIPGEYCIDLPCGNGRNIFLLASHFRKVLGVDINDQYLSSITSSSGNYPIHYGNVLVERMDINAVTPNSVRCADMVCLIHYYDYSLAQKLLKEMKPGAFFYIETPSCAGENYRHLPGETEARSLFVGTDVLLFKINACKSNGQRIKGISFKVLLKKVND